MTGNLNHLFSEDSTQTLARMMLYGAPKTKKTWWIGKAAEAGFNPIFLDGDNGFHVLRNIADNAKHRITHVTCHDDIGKPIFAPLIITLLKSKRLLWNNTTRQKELSSRGLNPADEHLYFDLTKLTNRDILCVDSFTAFVTSLNLRYAVENNVDLTDAEKWEWDGYAYSGMLIDWFLNSLRGLPCHIAVIGHETQYEKRDKMGNIMWSKTVMKSSSNPKSLTVPSDFSDILYFSILGGYAKIDTRAEAERIGGCRGVPPKVYDWDDLQFTDLCKAYSIPVPGNCEREFDCAGVQSFLPGQEVPEDLIGGRKTPMPIQTAGAEQPASAKINLFSKKG